jgi:thiosulfate dehydrogenase
MLKGIVSGVAITFGVALIGAFALVESGFIPANADVKPGWLETWMARTSLDATLSRVAPKEQNPVALTEQNLIEGLYQKPPQLATDGVEDDPEGESFWKIKHGFRLTGMPSFGYTLKDEQIWTLALFLKHMDKLPPIAEQAWQQVQNWPVSTAGQTINK